jgi:hydrogenase maturation factor
MLLATIPRDKLSNATNALEALGINYSIIGDVVAGKPRVELVRGSSIDVVTGNIPDEVMLLWKRIGNT